ncbi:modifier of rudimentary (Mod(r)) protein [Artemisia annua]|uniref:Modifier of rudimentary (Mod(R)) protein n=1 Tax=Artemisia annua TaxID=35608 RepID=A0A2U1P1D1_ARTAN|nr:modifier of rudimentary (Mod(r)) protein [Artemisia annua]
MVINVDELNKLSSDKEAYQEFLLSIDPVKTSNNVTSFFYLLLLDVLRDDLRNETLQLARENLAK